MLFLHGMEVILYIESNKVRRMRRPYNTLSNNDCENVEMLLLRDRNNE